MIINDSFPKFDLPIKFIADDSILGMILNYYSNFPNWNKPVSLTAHAEGMVKATINLLEVVIRRISFVLIFLIRLFRYTVSSDTHISFAGFSSDFAAPAT